VVPGVGGAEKLGTTVAAGVVAGSVTVHEHNRRDDDPRIS
jgi:hypothetical protein